VKRARLPSAERLAAAAPRLAATYGLYVVSAGLGPALVADARLRFSRVPPGGPDFPATVAQRVVDYLAYLAEARNLARFG
jgi:hypothetical protein